MIRIPFIFATYVLCSVIPGIVRGDDIAEGIPSLAGLLSNDFLHREASQRELENWALQQPTMAAPRLLAEVKSATEPEVRERCEAVLRRLADVAYLQQGQGYIGIRMQDEQTLVPGKMQPQWGIRVAQVVTGSAAEKAGILANDVVVGMEGLLWPSGEASMPFREQVMKMKPGSLLRLEVLRDKELRNVEVKLGKMPAILKRGLMVADVFQDPIEAERQDRDEHYQQWLEKLMAVPPQQ